ncbi:hypothetical protein EDC94DRAFT_626150 [Helicostylum pulchrum]|nr:hypothetical protein EDC94DRAFT_626150 [Helicostylum pulchrum]
MVKYHRVGSLDIIDLSSGIYIDILKAQMSVNRFDAIMEATRSNPITMSTYANEVTSALVNSSK